MTIRSNERSTLLSVERQEDGFQPPRSRLAILLAVLLTAFLVASAGNHFLSNDASLETKALRYPDRLGRSKHHKEQPFFQLVSRCEWVQEKFQEKDAHKSDEELRSTYATQSTDSNFFYRATANLFWNDFVTNNWANKTVATLKLPENILNPKSTWTWVTGDQHLSNFGAWRNRNNEVVFSVNDFDEAAIYDFQVDVLRIAVSICNHAITNGLSNKEVDHALRVFSDSYVDTVVSYVGNEDALLFELTPDTAYGVLQSFLKKVERNKSAKGQLQKFTQVNAEGIRQFIKGPVDTPDENTNLAAVPASIQEKIRGAFSPTYYGATMMKLGWHVRQWNSDYFEVLDVAERVGSGVGSLGVDRYYVLLKGTDGLLGEEGEDGTAVILDVKEQPLAAVERVLSANDAAWYKVMFSNAAARVVEAQRHLTSYVDPFTGWLMLPDEHNGLRPFNVRQRSPWQNSINLDSLTRPDDFNDFIAQIAVATATSHVRGTVAKAPAQFKDVIYSIFMEKKSNKKKWGKQVANLAKAYHEQVLLDYECFRAYVQVNNSGDEDSS